MTHSIQFDNGAAYEYFMGAWSALVGEAFLEWLAVPAGLRWADIGCGNGAFTEMLLDRCAPSGVDGIDPSEAQLAYATTRLAARGARFQRGDAMHLPFDDDTFGAAVMPLVIFFVPEPARGVAEMTRVVRGGGIVSAYAWDMAGAGFPYAVMASELRNMGFAVPEAPSPQASRLETMRELWEGAGLTDVDTHVITVERTFESFDEYWTILLLAPSAGPTLAKLTSDESARLQTALRERLPADANGRITYSSRAHAVKGRIVR